MLFVVFGGTALWCMDRRGRVENAQHHKMVTVHVLFAGRAKEVFALSLGRGAGHL